MTAWSHWSQGTIDGHAHELALLTEHMPDCSIAEACMSDGLPAVVGYADGRLISCSLSRGVVWGEGIVEVRLDGPSATLMQGDVFATYFSVPSAIAIRTLSEDLRR